MGYPRRDRDNGFGLHIESLVSDGCTPLAAQKQKQVTPGVDMRAEGAARHDADQRHLYVTRQEGLAEDTVRRVRPVGTPLEASNVEDVVRTASGPGTATRES